MRAFQAAKNKIKSTNSHGPDYVSRAEFRYLLSYLRQYYEYWVAFTRLDKNFDRRISLAELTSAGPTLERWGIKMVNPAATFKEMDTDGKGMVLFDEFVAWAIKKNL
jgi:Ca2+-binding EF-hand superfamily protein